MNNRIRKILSAASVLLWMLLIFWFSAQPANISGEMSMDTGRFIGKLVISDYSSLPKEKQDAFAENIEYAVRKTAHASEYAVLGILLFQAACAWDLRKKRHVFYCIIAGASYAATDEFHQLFIPGRSGRFTDVLIDTGGVIAGTLIAYFICFLLNKRRRRHEETLHKMGQET